MNQPILACVLRRPLHPQPDPFLACLVSVTRALQGSPELLKAMRAVGEAKRRVHV